MLDLEDMPGLEDMPPLPDHLQRLYAAIAEEVFAERVQDGQIVKLSPNRDGLWWAFHAVVGIFDPRVRLDIPLSPHEVVVAKFNPNTTIEVNQEMPVAYSDNILIILSKSGAVMARITYELEDRECYGAANSLFEWLEESVPWLQEQRVVLFCSPESQNCLRADILRYYISLLASNPIKLLTYQLGGWFQSNVKVEFSTADPWPILTTTIRRDRWVQVPYMSPTP